MGRLYSIMFDQVAVTAAQDLFEVLAPADAVMVVHALVITQSSDAGDAQSEQLHVTLKRVTGAPTSGSGGSSAVPQPLEQGDAAAGITAEVNNTTRLTGGSSTTILWPESWNVMAGMSFVPTPEMRPVISPSTRLVVGLETTPADSVTMNGVLIVEEIGG